MDNSASLSDTELGLVVLAVVLAVAVTLGVGVYCVKHKNRKKAVVSSQPPGCRQIFFIDISSTLLLFYTLNRGTRSTNAVSG